jgi:hypothetical protein
MGARREPQVFTNSLPRFTTNISAIGTARARSSASTTRHMAAVTRSSKPPNRRSRRRMRARRSAVEPPPALQHRRQKRKSNQLRRREPSVIQLRALHQQASLLRRSSLQLVLGKRRSRQSTHARARMGRLWCSCSGATAKRHSIPWPRFIRDVPKRFALSYSTFQSCPQRLLLTTAQMLKFYEAHLSFTQTNNSDDAKTNVVVESSKKAGGRPGRPRKNPK